MKIKNKLLIGFGLLFLVVVFFGIVAIYYIEDISEYSKVTVKNNYETLTFTRAMRSVLDENELPLSNKAAGDFENALTKQEHNITEPGEKKATADLRLAFNQLVDPSQSIDKKRLSEKTARLQLSSIEGLNMKAIVDKNNHIHTTVSDATLYLSGIVFVTFLILFVFIVNFPGFILNPLNQFIDGVHEINQKNYDVRMDLQTNDEFALLCSEFNTMASRLNERENQNLTRILSAENQVKIIIEESPDVIIGVDEQQEIIFANKAARKILKLGDGQVNGKPVKELAKNNSQLRNIIEYKGTGGKFNIPVDGKMTDFKLKRVEIVVPNLRSGEAYTLQFSGFPAGMIYILKASADFKEHGEIKAL